MLIDQTPDSINRGTMLYDPSPASTSAAVNQLATQSDALDIRPAIQRRLDPQKFAMWFQKSSRLTLNPSTHAIEITVPSKFVSDWIVNTFAAELKAAACETIEHTTHQYVKTEQIKIEVVVDKSQFKSHSDAAAYAATGINHDATTSGTPGASSTSSTARRHRRSSTPSATMTSPRALGHSRANRRRDTPPELAHLRHQLSDFIVGPSNALAYAASEQLAEEAIAAFGLTELDPTTAQQSPMPNGSPLFVHGGCGLGKTHLLHGICHKVITARLEAGEDPNVMYTTGEQFTNRYIEAIRTNNLDAFRREMRGLDLLAIDDIHFIATRTKTQQEFLHCFDEIEQSGARVVMASDSHPKLIEHFSEHLVSRCVRGLVLQIQPPDLETRQRLIQTFAIRRRIVLQNAAAQRLAETQHGSVREIEGTIAKLHAMVSLSGELHQPVGMAMVDRLLSQNELNQPSRPVHVDTILETVCEQLQLPTDKVLSPSRHKHLVLARSIAIYLIRDLTPLSYPEIAHALGRPNHSTIITAYQRIKKQVATDDPFLLPHRTSSTTMTQLIDEIRRAIMNRNPN